MKIVIAQIVVIAATFVLALGSPHASAHSGGLDKNGGHTNRRTGGYHYHQKKSVWETSVRGTPARGTPVREFKPPCALGFCMGQIIMGESLKNNGFSYYKAESDYFSTLWVMHTPKAGVCKVTAYQVVVDPDQYGIEHRRTFDNLAQKIVAKYGKQTKELDSLLIGSIWNEPRDWLMGLVKKERVLILLWKLPQFSIAIQAKPSLVELTYDFPNFDACKAEAEASILPEF